MLSDAQQIAQLVKPYVEQGLILPRGVDFFSERIDEFELLKIDKTVVACAGLKVYQQQKMAEIYSVAVHSNHQNQGLGEQLFHQIETIAKEQHIKAIFALSKYSAHWFLRRGFYLAELAELPVSKQAVFDYQRNPSIFIKSLIA